jgi:predicted metal-dependent hydrolase
VRSQKTRWGSCSFNNNISLNVKLTRLPQELIDYVILHELAHTRIKNHGREFWKMLDGLIGDAKKLDRRLREYQPILHWRLSES